MCVYIITYGSLESGNISFSIVTHNNYEIHTHIVHCGAFCSMRLCNVSHTIDIHIMPLFQYIDCCCIHVRNVRRTMAFHLFINLFTFTQRLNTFFVFAAPIFFFCNFHCSSFMYHGHHGIILITVEMLFSVYCLPVLALQFTGIYYTYIIVYKFYCVTDYDISRKYGDI